MSSKKEDYIISEIAKELSQYDLYLTNYDYFIRETNYNEYEIELENINTKKIILIKKIKMNDQNKVLSVGVNNGLVL